jgi:iron complex outermembrane receptor protein
VLSLIDNTRLGNIEDSNPKWRAVLSESFTSGMFDVTARLNYFGKYTTYFAPIGAVPAGVDPVAFRALYPAPNPAGNVGEWPKEFGAQVSFDLEVGLTFAENYRIAIGAENLFGTYPARETRNVYPSTGGQANGSLYPGSAPIGQMGGFYYARVQLKF